MNSPKLSPEQYAHQILSGNRSLLNSEYLRYPEYRAAFDKLLSERTAWTHDVEKDSDQRTAAPLENGVADKRTFTGSHQTWRWPTFKEALCIAVAIAVVGFLFINPYYSGRGVVGNIVRGGIALSEPCTLASEPPTPDGCGKTLPYRWLLVALIIFVSFIWYRANGIRAMNRN